MQVQIPKENQHVDTTMVLSTKSGYLSSVEQVIAYRHMVITTITVCLRKKDVA